MIGDPLLCAVVAGGLAAVVLSYCLGHFRGMEAAFDQMRNSPRPLPPALFQDGTGAAEGLQDPGVSHGL